ncbi:unnamed protein product [Psylliodes chrysocephalus]|uniref:Vitellogenin domain-containing protein n=1 Tax=Psylliodes chrysocephalus TaxID=3402493 RepID=A0A9P0D1N7_9CUCU|nr:unnamed protein product [Psylliodes chrysocephala]
MFRCINSYSILYILFALSIGMCYGFVLLSSASGDFSDVNIFENGQSLRYKLQSTILLNERNLSAKNVGFFIDGEVTIDSIWTHGDQKLLKIEIKSPKLHIRSRKAPSPDGFIPHSSKLDNIENNPFFIVWNKGIIENTFIAKNEPVSLKNIKKGISSLFQFQLLDGETTETDSSGKCSVTYTSSSPSTFTKTKNQCASGDFDYINNPNHILGVKIDSTRTVDYELASNPFIIKSIILKESHSVFLTAREEMGNHIEAQETLTFIDSKKANTVEGTDLEKAIENISNKLGVKFNRETLLTEIEPIQTEDEISFSKKVERMRSQLKIEHMGSTKQAKVFTELVNSARNAPKEDILKTLTTKKNKPILTQLYDILGYVGTLDSHTTVMKNLHFDKEEQIDFSERYLWALSFSSNPNLDVIKDLHNKFNKINSIPEKVKETLILTLASMTYRLSKTAQAKYNIHRDVEETIINNLDYAKNEDKYKFFRALRNLKSESTVPVLLEYIKKGTQKEGVLAWRAIKDLDSSSTNKDILTAAEKTFFQLDRRHDTSSRTIAADIILQSSLNNELLTKLLNFLTSNDPAYEIKQYLFQRIKMLAESDLTVKNNVEQIIKSNKHLNNYSGTNPRGLSISLTRRFLNHPSSNGSLVTVQEMKSGVIKRGTIDVVIEKEEFSNELFSLGIFSGGLHTFMSSDNGGNEEADEETATAGIELTVLGTQIRPFVFFSGQGELMGHVWSGTASERTPAYQVLALLHDHLEYIRLGSGFITNINIKGATSMDLSGQIEISLWNRNAESLVQKAAGIVVTGSSTIDTMFVKSLVEFSSSIEPKLNLHSDIDFSSNLHLCMRLTQPDAVFRHNIYKVERIPGSKHKMRISKYQKYIVPGTTYNINKKNNQMCNAIFS